MNAPTKQQLAAHYGYIYRITNNLTGRIYVGKRVSKPGESWDDYTGSSKTLERDIALYGSDHFTKHLLEFANDDHALKIAEHLHIVAAILTGHAYNLTAPLGLGDGLTDDDTFRLLVARMSEKPRPTVERDLRIIRNRLYHDTTTSKSVLQRLYEVHLFALSLMDERAFLERQTHRARAR